MPQLEVLVLEFRPINAFSSGSIVVCEISSLAHELRDHPERKHSTNNARQLQCINIEPVKRAAFISEARFTSAQLTEVFGSSETLRVTFQKVFMVIIAIKNSDLFLLGNNITPKLHGDPAKLLPISCHVKIYARKRGSLQLRVKTQASWESQLGSPLNLPLLTSA